MSFAPILSKSSIFESGGKLQYQPGCFPLLRLAMPLIGNQLGCKNRRIPIIYGVLVKSVPCPCVLFGEELILQCYNGAGGKGYSYYCKTVIFDLNYNVLRSALPNMALQQNLWVPGGSSSLPS